MQSTLNLKAMLNAEMAFARHMIEQNREMDPHWLIECGSGETLIFFTRFIKHPDGSDNKDDQLRLVRAVLIWKKAVSYVFAHEAWMTHHSESNPWSGIQPSQSEARKEVLMVCMRAKDGASNFVVPIEVVDGKRALGEPEEFGKGPGEGLAGRMMIPLPEEDETLPPVLISALEAYMAESAVPDPRDMN